MKIMRIEDPKDLDPELKKFAISALIYSVIQFSVFLT
jgi:hypothetical protein